MATMREQGRHGDFGQTEAVISKNVSQMEAMLAGKNDAEVATMIAQLKSQIAALSPAERESRYAMVAAAERIIAAHS